MTEEESEHFWKKIFFSTLVVGIIIFTLGFVTTSNNNQIEIPEGSKLVNYYWTLDDGTIVYYEGYVVRNGASFFNLTAVCSPVTNECRLPNKQEIEEGHYIPQNSE